MRNADLDKELPIDKLIGQPELDEIGEYRTISGKKIYQIRETTQRDKDLNLIINRVLASGMTPTEFLNQ